MDGLAAQPCYHGSELATTEILYYGWAQWKGLVCWCALQLRSGQDRRQALTLHAWGAMQSGQKRLQGNSYCHFLEANYRFSYWLDQNTCKHLQNPLYGCSNSV